GLHCRHGGGQISRRHAPGAPPRTGGMPAGCRDREARDLIERAKAWVAATNERYYEAEIHRLDAEVTLAEAGGADRASAAAFGRAGALLQTAIECARRQGARTFELRATTMLACVCRRRAHRAVPGSPSCSPDSPRASTAPICWRRVGWLGGGPAHRKRPDKAGRPHNRLVPSRQTVP